MPKREDEEWHWVGIIHVELMNMAEALGKMLSSSLISLSKKFLRPCLVARWRLNGNNVLTAKTHRFFRVMWFLIRRQHSCQLQPYMNMNSLIATHPDPDYSAQFAEEQKKPKKCLLNQLEFLIYLRHPNIDSVYIFVTFFSQSLLRSNFICFTSDCKSILRN